MNEEALHRAWLIFKEEHCCSIDRMLCDPDLRGMFVKHAAELTGSNDEQAILWELMGMRKRKRFSATQSATKP